MEESSLGAVGAEGALGPSGWLGLAPAGWFEELVERSGDLVLVLGRDLTVVYTNGFSARLLGLRRGSHLLETMPGDVSRELFTMVSRSLDENRTMRRYVFLRGRFFDSSFVPLAGPAGDLELVLYHARRAYVGEAREGAEDGAAPERLSAWHDLDKLGSLKPHEFQTLRLIGLGLPSRRIAKLLHKSPRTIEHYAGTLARKLNARNRQDLVRVAIRSGMSGIEEDPDAPGFSAQCVFTKS